MARSTVNAEPLVSAEPVPAAVQPLYAAPTTFDRIGRIIAPVKVNGQGPFRFVIDTGATRSMLTPHLATALQLPLANEKSVSLSGVTGHAVVGTVPVSRIDVGDLVLRDMNLPVVDSVLADADGLLGVEGFAGKRLTVDFVHDSITIETSNGKRAPRGFITLPAHFGQGRLLLVDAMVGKVKVKAVIDTGAQGTLGNARLQEALQRQKTKDSQVGIAAVGGVTSDIQKGDLSYAPLIKFRNMEIEGLKVTYGDFYVFKLWNLEQQPALLVGMDVLGTVDVLVIDYLRHEVQIKPLSGKSRRKK